MLDVVVEEVDFHLLRFSSGGLGVDFTVVGVAECPVVGDGEEAHGVCLEVGERFDCRAGLHGHAVNVHRASVALTEEEHRLSVGAEHGAAVFSGVAGEGGVLFGGGVVAPQVACHTGSVVLAQGIFHAFLVLVDEEFAFFVPGDFFGGRADHLGCSSAFDGPFIELRH